MQVKDLEKGILCVDQEFAGTLGVLVKESLTATNDKIGTVVNPIMNIDAFPFDDDLIGKGC